MEDQRDKELTVQMATRRINAVQKKAISLSTVYNMIINGRLRAFRRGKACIRIKESEIVRFLTEDEDACTENF